MDKDIEPTIDAQIVVVYTESGDAIIEVWGISELQEIVVIDGNDRT